MKTPTETLKQSTAMERVPQSSFLYELSSRDNLSAPVLTPKGAWRRHSLNEVISWIVLRQRDGDLQDQPQNGQMLYLI